MDSAFASWGVGTRRSRRKAAAELAIRIRSRKAVRRERLQRGHEHSFDSVTVSQTRGGQLTSDPDKWWLEGGDLVNSQVYC